MNFNPRSREGSDGALWSWQRSPSHFNPRSREGSDASVIVYTIILMAFQSTLPRRERQTTPASRPSAAAFQSTLPRRERHNFHFSTTPTLQFQSTLPRRERHTYAVTGSVLVEFQSTLPRRERRAGGWLVPAVKVISIHAPAKGATKDLSNHFR